MINLINPLVSMTSKMILILILFSCFDIQVIFKCFINPLVSVILILILSPLFWYSSHIHVFYKPAGFCHIEVDPNFESVLVCLNIQVTFMCFINPWLL